MRKGFSKAAFIIGMIGLLGIGYTVPAKSMEADVNSNMSDVMNANMPDGNEETDSSVIDGTDRKDNGVSSGQESIETITENTDNDSRAGNNEDSEVAESIAIDGLSVNNDTQSDENNIQPHKQSEDVIQKEDSDGSDNMMDTSGDKGITYYLNMKRYEMLSNYYKKMDELLLRKVELYKLLKDSGEITDLTVKQIEMQEQQMAYQKSICDNEVEYNRFIISQLGLSFDDVDIKTIKNVGDIESYATGKSEYEMINIARYVTDCKNAVVNIKSKEKELEMLTAVNEQMKLLKEAGDASELEVIDSELEVLKAKMELDGYYYDMNVAYYLIINIDG